LESWFPAFHRVRAWGSTIRRAGSRAVAQGLAQGGLAQGGLAPSHRVSRRRAGSRAVGLAPWVSRRRAGVSRRRAGSRTVMQVLAPLRRVSRRVSHRRDGSRAVATGRDAPPRQPAAPRGKITNRIPSHASGAVAQGSRYRSVAAISRIRDDDHTPHASSLKLTWVFSNTSSN